MSLISRLNSLWKCPNEHFGLLFRTPSHSRDRRFDLAGSAFDFDRLSAADRCRSFASVRKMTSEARIRREEQKFGRSACKRSVYSLGKAAILAFFLDRGLVVQRVSFVWRAASAGGLRDDTAAGNVASLPFTRKCLLHGASDSGCGNGFLFSRRPRPVSQSFQSALAWFRLLRASDCRCGNGFSL